MGKAIKLKNNQTGEMLYPVTGSDLVFDPDSKTSVKDDLAKKVEEAPEDGKQYARKDGAWVEVEAGSGSGDGGSESKTETLTVSVTGISSGYTVTVKKSDGTVIGSQTTATKEYSIEAGTQYYVTASSASGYVTPSDSATRTAVAGATHTIVMSYVAHAGTTSPTNGVYIQDTDGYFHTSSEWDGTYTANGVAVITDDCRFVMALADAYSSGCNWGSYGTEVSGITTAESEIDAMADYDGEAQTTTILNVLGNDSSSAPAAYYCRAYTFPDGSKGYMGAAGEWQAALDNKSAVETALSKCGGTEMSVYYWTSTQYSSDHSWYMHWNDEYMYGYIKSVNQYVRAFSAI